MYSDKEGVKYLLQVLAGKAVNYYVISPGSRNAPLTVSLAAHPQMQCLSVVDERSAGFFALGMAQQLHRPVGLVCTSGTAALNYGPALAEAYYQRIPLVALTADRPEELIHQREGQALNQQEVFSNYVKASFNLPQEPYDADRLWFLQREAANILEQAVESPQGPVHVNIPLREPLYQTNETLPHFAVLHHFTPQQSMTDEQLQQLVIAWKQASRILVVVGAFFPGEIDAEVLNRLHAGGAVILAEHTANVAAADTINSFDQILYKAPDEGQKALMPDLLIYCGRDLVSKRLKQFLRKSAPKTVWAIDEASQAADTFKALTLHIRMSPANFFRQLADKLPKNSTAYQQLWYRKQKRLYHVQRIFKAHWSDFKAFREIISRIPPQAHLHLGNSAPVRYTQLFPPNQQIKYYANRGTSGIDGVLSTAAGAAYASAALTVVIAGDLTMNYDSNALWNNYLPPGLRIVVINNQGGGIFRLIPGPLQSPWLEEYFEAYVPADFGKLAEAYGIAYFRAEDAEALNRVWPRFVEEQKQAALLEVVTPREVNPEVYNKYFEYINHQLWQQHANGKL